MLIKLIKYDFSVGLKKYLLMTFIMAAVFISVLSTKIITNDVYFSFTLIFSALGMIAFFIVYTIVSILHFYSQMSGRESYLTYTLPVSEGKILMSKFITILVWGLYVTGILVLFIFTVIDPFILTRLDSSATAALNAVSIQLNMTVPFLLTTTVILGVASVLMNVITYGFCMTIINVPKLKYKNSGIPIAAAAAVVLPQIVGFFQMGIWFLYLLLTTGNLSIIFNENKIRDMNPLFDSLNIATIITCVIITPIFFLLGRWVIKKHRSI